jgi:putative lipoprotein
VVVRVEDVSRADAPSTVIAQQLRRRVSLKPGETLPFEVDVPAERIDERRSYSLSAHIRASGSEGVKPGDLITTESFPVLTRGHGDEWTIRVKRV